MVSHYYFPQGFEGITSQCNFAAVMINKFSQKLCHTIRKRDNNSRNDYENEGQPDALSGFHQKELSACSAAV